MHTINLIFIIFYTFHFFLFVYWDRLLESYNLPFIVSYFPITPRILAEMSPTMVHDVIQMVDISIERLLSSLTMIYFFIAL